MSVEDLLFFPLTEEEQKRLEDLESKEVQITVTINGRIAAFLEKSAEVSGASLQAIHNKCFEIGVSDLVTTLADKLLED
jgi:hypothetical protein